MKTLDLVAITLFVFILIVGFIGFMDAMLQPKKKPKAKYIKRICDICDKPILNTNKVVKIGKSHCHKKCTKITIQSNKNML